MIITILARCLGIMLLPYTDQFKKKMPSAIYLFTTALSYFALSTYIAYLDFSFIFITVAGACLCINLIWNVLKDPFKLSGEKLFGVGFVLIGGILSLIL
jgi:multidrug transporter EmrE-like cation transporter